MESCLNSLLISFSLWSDIQPVGHSWMQDSRLDDLSTCLLHHHSEEGAFGILLIRLAYMGSQHRVIQVSRPDQVWLSDADSSKNCLWLQERLPSATGSGSALSRQLTWSSDVSVMEVILVFPSISRPDMKPHWAWIDLALHEKPVQHLRIEDEGS